MYTPKSMVINSTYTVYKIGTKTTRESTACLPVTGTFTFFFSFFFPSLFLQIIDSVDQYKYQHFTWLWIFDQEVVSSPVYVWVCVLCWQLMIWKDRKLRVFRAWIKSSPRRPDSRTNQSRSRLKANRCIGQGEIRCFSADSTLLLSYWIGPKNSISGNGQSIGKRYGCRRGLSQLLLFDLVEWKIKCYISQPEPREDKTEIVSVYYWWLSSPGDCAKGWWITVELCLVHI